MRSSTSFMLLAVLAAGCGELASGEYDTGATESSPDGATQEIEPGTLTAGAWDDNRNYDYFRHYLDGLDVSGAPPIPRQDQDRSQEDFGGERPANGSLDIAFVVDNTGSMGDEIEYLKVEFSAIAATIKAEFPDVTVRWASIAYQDQGDAYVVRTQNFTTSIDTVQSSIDEMFADGGGDYPEDVASALEETVSLDWQSEGRLVFWIADAPHHDADAQRVADSLLTARELDVHVYPVAASGVDELAELTMRSAAQLTGGRYLFLTNDSGVGADHKEPVIPCYFVTKLDDAVVRMVSIEVSGEYVEPDADDIIRTGGDPENGACHLADGSTVVAF